MRVLSCSLAVALFSVAPSASALAQSTQTLPAAAIEGAVVDASTGLGLPDATVVVLDAARERATTDAAGRFRIAGIPAGVLRVEIRKNGYQTTDSDDFATVAGGSASLTLSMQRAQTTSSQLGVIGRTSTRASQSLQKTSVIYKDVSASAIQSEGYYRVGDYLRTLPHINVNGGSETPTPGDDLYFDIRGLGALETVTLLDGHPIAYGHKRGNNLGYNFAISPTFALRDVQVTFGSGGSDLVGISAIGGVIDMRTLEPTTESHSTLTQGYGSYSNLVSTLSATGRSRTASPLHLPPACKIAMGFSAITASSSRRRPSTSRRRSLRRTTARESTRTTVRSCSAAGS